MINQYQIKKPKNRSELRRFLGKELYILKRWLIWHVGLNNFAKIDNKTQVIHSLIKHKSFLLRPLKGVDMYLQHNKVVNLKIAISTLHGVVIKPGQTYSLWRLVGRPTKSKGYVEGMTLNNGQITKGIGGGLCQLGNLIYWMALHSPITIKERWRHGYDVFPDLNRTIPFACGATLAYNYVDLQLYNHTGYTFKINLWIDNEYLNGELLCDADLNSKYEIIERDHIFQQQWWGGYTRHNKIWKRITNLTNNHTSEELVAENSAIMMYSPLIDS